MNKSIKKSFFTLITLCGSLSGSGVAFGAEFPPAASKNAIGATDFYQVNCGENTDHLSVRVIDQTPGGVNSPSVLPQYVNLHVSKGAIASDASEISPGEQAELTVPAGKGFYTFGVMANGPALVPNSKKKLKQTITAEYQCLNDAGTPIKAGAKTKKITNNKSVRFSINCGKNKKLGVETTKLYVKLTNTTVPVSTVDPAIVALNAQIVKGNAAANTTDFNGDDVFSEEATLMGGAGIYSVLVDNTAFNPSQNNSRNYTLQYSCRDAAGNEVTTNTAQLINSLP